MADPTFLADSMLGRVAKWLVLLGYDAAFAGAGIDDFELVLRAKREGRVLLTRDTRLPPAKGVRVLVLREQAFEDQLRRVLDTLGLKAAPERLFTRCAPCNAPLRPLERAQALPRVPEKVRALQSEFFECPACRRVYWAGSHVDQTVARLRRLGIL